MSIVAVNSITDASGGNTASINGYSPTESNMAGRNAIINGNFDIWQRGTSFTLTTSFQYTADRWRAKVGTGGAGSLVRNVDISNNPLLTFVITTAGTGTHEMSQPIEGAGSVVGDVSVSFNLARSSGSGTVDVTLLQFFGSGGSPSAAVPTFLGTITPTASLTRYSLTGTLPSIAGKTFGTNGDDVLVLILVPSNSVATYDIAQVQIEAGSVATPFERRPVGTELALCQRYYETGNCGGVSYASSGAAYQRFWCPYTQKRVFPSVTLTKTGGTATSPAGAGAYINGVFVAFSSTDASQDILIAFTADAEL